MFEEYTLIEGFGNELTICLTSIFVLFGILLHRLPWSALTESESRSHVEVYDEQPQEEEDVSLLETTSQGEQPTVSTEADEESEDDTQVQIRLKYLDDTERNVESTLGTKLGAFKNEHFEKELLEGKIVRLITGGKLLNEEGKSLGSFGLTETNNILHVQISTQPPRTRTAEMTSGPTSQTDQVEVNVGSVTYPAMGLTLVILWYIHFQFRDMFTSSATTALASISGLFCVFLFAPEQPIYLQAIVQQVAPEL